MATAAIIFGIAYLLIASGRIPHVLIAVLGAMAMVLLGVLTEHEASPTWTSRCCCCWPG